MCILEALIFGAVILFLILKKKNTPEDDEPISAEPVESTDDEVDELLSKYLAEDEPEDAPADEADELLKKFLAEVEPANDHE